VWEALEILSRALPREPDDSATMYEIGSVQAEPRRFQEARVSLGRAITRTPNKPARLISLAPVHRALGERAEAGSLLK